MGDRKFIINSQSNISEPFLCQKNRLDVFLNFHVRPENQFIEEEFRIRKLSDVAQWNYGGIKGLFAVFSDTKKIHNSSLENDIDTVPVPKIPSRCHLHVVCFLQEPILSRRSPIV